MTAIKPAGLDSFLRKPDPAVGALLIYGEEPDAVRELASRAVKKVAGSLDDPFSVMTLAEQDLASDPARLADEVQSISMFGGRKAIWVKGAGDAFLKAVLPVLEGRASGNLVVAEASTLAKSSQLRAMFEKSPNALVIPLYEAEPGEVAQMVEQILAQDNLRIGPDALTRFMALAGTAGIMRVAARVRASSRTGSIAMPCSQGRLCRPQPRQRNQGSTSSASGSTRPCTRSCSRVIFAVGVTVSRCSASATGHA
jgi:DNA polymerase III delta subunit